MHFEFLINDPLDRKRSRFNEKINKKLTGQLAIQTAIRVSCILLSIKENEFEIAGHAI